MQIQVNKEAKDVASESTLDSLVGSLNLSGKKGIAIAINQRVIPKQLWESTKLQENDSVTIITATQGG